MLSTVSALGAQNIGAGKPERAIRTLRYAVLLAVSFGVLASITIQFTAEQIVALFTDRSTAAGAQVVRLGGQYLRGYIFDCIFAGMDYVDALSGDCRVLLFDYPQQLRTNQALVAGMHAFFQKLGIERPIFVGASGGGMVAQIYVQKYPREAGGLILISTGGMDGNTLKALKKQYFFAPLMLWYMKRCNYEKLKPKLIHASMRHIRSGDCLRAGYV